MTRWEEEKSTAPPNMQETRTRYNSPPLQAIIIAVQLEE